MGRGMFSDDTEHTLMLATALIENQDDAVAFLQAFVCEAQVMAVGTSCGSRIEHG
jgi:ADP-ribosylglycohydrolase